MLHSLKGLRPVLRTKLWRSLAYILILLGPEGGDKDGKEKLSSGDANLPFLQDQRDAWSEAVPLVHVLLCQHFVHAYRRPSFPIHPHSSPPGNEKGFDVASCPLTALNHWKDTSTQQLPASLLRFLLIKKLVKKPLLSQTDLDGQPGATAHKHTRFLASVSQHRPNARALLSFFQFQTTNPCRQSVDTC